jgi:hypothetical protein
VIISPDSIQLGIVPHGKASSGVTRIYRSDFPNWQLGAVRFTDRSLTGNVTEIARRGNEVWYDLHVHLANDTPVGYITARAVMATNDPSTPQLPVMVEGQVQAEVVASPATLFLGVLQPGDKVTRSLVVRSGKPFHINSMEGDKDAFEFPKTPDGARQLYVLPVTFVAGAEVGKVVKTIRIQTDASATPIEVSSYAVVNAR